MARHRAPDVALPLHGPSPTAGHPGTGRPRHAAGPAPAVETPVQVRTGRHRAAPTLEFVGPILVADAEPRPVVVVAAPAAPIDVPEQPAPAREPDPGPGYRQPYAEVVSWAAFASLVSCAVVGAGQGERAQAVWTLGVSGAVLSTVGLGLFAAGRRRVGGPQ
jgi:hypothetical protein